LDASTNINFDAGRLDAGFGKLFVAEFVLLNAEGSLVQLNSRTVSADKMMVECFIK
jgi:hypothetical protein